MGARAVAWVTCGPEPYLATCQRCGGHVAKPDLPVALQGFVMLLKAAAAMHRNCRAVEAG